MSADKPVLDTVTSGWNVHLNNLSVTCTTSSNRQDSTTMHQLCTQITLLITAKDQVNTSSHQVTMHLYHTRSKIQVQGSTIVSPGMSSSMWVVKNLIEPMTVRHIATNQQSIAQINNAIISSSDSNPVLHSCQSCSSIINPSSTHARDLPLSCGKCSRMFHKRCTNKSGVKGKNWNKSPWYCS